MIKVENVDVWGFQHAIRGMRNPMNSWERSDSGYCWDVNHDCASCIYVDPENDGSDGTTAICKQLDWYEEFYAIGKNDLALMQKLYRAGPEHRKYLRQIFVSMDIVAPLYWWKEFDTYKIGVTVNSCSTMHKIAAKEFELGDFSYEHLLGYGSLNWGDIVPMAVLECVVQALNTYRKKFIDCEDPEEKKVYWWQMIQLLPSSYNQRRTVTMSYENVVNIIHQRTGHKLDEWRDLITELMRLPYVDLLVEKESHLELEAKKEE
jgi:hypothetical protein